MFFDSAIIDQIMHFYNNYVSNNIYYNWLYNYYLLIIVIMNVYF